jgi:crotonobetainyl-CoA:carnitine CoA-transferase CaiB-like acyl-CoA transferase
MTMDAASERLDAERIPFAMVLRPDQLPDDPHAQAIGMFERRDHPIAGRTRLPRHPARFGSTPARLAGNSPGLGEHTDEVLSELGLSERIAELRTSGAIG